MEISKWFAQNALTSSVVCGPYLMINATLPTYIWISMKCDGVLSSTCRRYQLTVRIMFASNSLAQFKGIIQYSNFSKTLKRYASHCFPKIYGSIYVLLKEVFYSSGINTNIVDSILYSQFRPFRYINCARNIFSNIYIN